MAARRKGSAAAALLAAVLAGCGESEEPVDDVEAAPLEVYLEEIWGDWDPDDPDPTRAQAEELVAACMAEAGFEYYPMIEIPTYVQITPMLPVTVEVAEEFGYGLSIEAGGPGTGTEQWWAPPQESPAERANREYVAALSTAARAQYERALTGDREALLEEGADGETADQGCQGRSYDQAALNHTPPDFTEVREAMDQVFVRVEEDPRVIDAQRPWGPCMAEAGYPGLTEFGDARILVRSMVGQFISDTATRIDRSLGETEYDAIKASVPEELAALQADEIAVAVADATCREESGYNRTLQEVTTEHERAFVDLYRDELDAWVAAARERAGQDASASD